MSHACLHIWHMGILACLCHSSSSRRLSERASASAGEGHRLGGAGGGGETSSAGLPAPGSDDMRARLAAAAEARLKAMNKQ